MTGRVALSIVLLTAALGGCRSTGSGESPVIRISPDAPLVAEPKEASAPSSLQRAIEAVDGPARIELAPGRYVLQPAMYTDPTCGNCQDPDTPVQVTLGLRLTGRGIEIVGGSADSVIIHTGAGYGILIEDCAECVVRGVTVTGGERDSDGNATSAAIVVRRSTAAIEECRIRDNIGDSATVALVVVGIAGIAGREGSDFVVTGCRIERNSWDGIALYRGARADIRDNVVDGVDKASGARVGGGRGVGIGLTWDAEANVEGNLVARYWKGIGVFVDAQATVRHNVVEDILTWGIAYWGAGEGRAVAVIEENAIHETGACGAMISRATGGEDPPGAFRRNAIVRTGQNPRYDSGEPYCTQRPIARASVPEGFEMSGNLLFDNRQPGPSDKDEDLIRAHFMERVSSLAEPLGASEATRASMFYRLFGGR
ncbi:MAG TPA: right-handed parallel beta-helix repeat-containing protein [Gemmatimonadaceae bacterium]|nr:right-handed parallel beta-helix repeat-containing protein [Gemmatimonadaceae bacterium]